MENPAVNKRGRAVLYHQAVWDENKSYLDIKGGQNIGNNTVAGKEGNLLFFSTGGFGEAKNRALICLKAWGTITSISFPYL